ncbi:MAG: glycosyltransferase [Nanoarchaeota archaeon]
MLSIVIPALNEEKYLPRLLDSIKKQTYKNYEIVIADADSKDNTRKIAKKYGCKVIKGGIPAVGRNNGAKAAKGDILLFMDADAIIGEKFLENGLNEMKSRKLDITGVYIYPDTNRLLDHIFLGMYNLLLFSTQFYYPHAVGSGIFCRKWLHKKVRGFDGNVRLGEDADYVKRCGKVGNFRILRTAKLRFSMRRYKKGRIKTGLGLIGWELHRIFFGEIKTDIFKYGWDNHEK